MRSLHSNKVVVRCKHGYTGLFSFLAIPLLMGNIMINIMNMIDINVNIMANVNAAAGQMIDSDK